MSLTKYILCGFLFVLHESSSLSVWSQPSLYYLLLYVVSPTHHVRYSNAGCAQIRISRCYYSSHLAWHAGHRVTVSLCHRLNRQRRSLRVPAVVCRVNKHVWPSSNRRSRKHNCPGREAPEAQRETPGQITSQSRDYRCKYETRPT